MIANDAEKWITVKPNGPDATGKHVKIDGETGEVKAGMGGKFTGQRISEIRKDFTGPKTPQAKSPKGTGSPENAYTPQRTQHNTLKIDDDYIRHAESLLKKAEAAEAKARQDFNDELNRYNRGRGSEENVRNADLKYADAKGYTHTTRTHLGNARKLLNDVFPSAGGQEKYDELFSRYAEKLRSEGRDPARSYGVPVEFINKQLGIQSPKSASNVSQTQKKTPEVTEAPASEFKRDGNGRLIFPAYPQFMPERNDWNNKFYAGNTIYVNGRKKKLTDNQVSQLKQWQETYRRYLDAKKEDAKIAPKEFLRIKYDNRFKAKALGAKDDPVTGRLYWDKRDGEMPEALKKLITPPKEKKQKTHQSNEVPETGTPANLGNAKYGSDSLAFDASPSSRIKDKNGFLHIGLSPITKEQVVEYYGVEIPGWQKIGLDPQKKYKGYRPAEEIEKAAPTFNGLPLLMVNHVPVSSTEPQKNLQVGSVGTEAQWKSPYLYQKLSITDENGVQGVESGEYVQISAAYRYEPDFTPGEFNGEKFDFVIRNLEGNHILLTKKGRAGPDVVVADSEPDLKTLMKNLTDDADVEALEVAAAQAIQQLAALIDGVHVRNPETGEIEDMTGDEDKNAAIDRILAAVGKYMPEEDIGKLKDELSDLAYSTPTGDDDFNAEEAYKYGENIERKHEERAEEPGGKDADPMNVREAVKAGENEERRRLDQEHESDGMRKAMDACGLDAESPEFQKAFAEGVKYGEEKMRNDREHIDRLHESEGAKHAMDSASIFQEMAERNKMAEQVSRHIGTFAYDSMTTKDVALYAAKKLGLKVDQDQAVTAVKAYMHNRTPQKTHAFAMDSAPARKESQVKKFYGME